MIDSPTVERNGRRHIYALSSIRTLQHCIFFVSNLVSILHISIVPIPFTSLFFPSTFYPLYPHIHGYIGRERKKKKIIHFPTGEINRDPRALRRRSLLFYLLPPSLPSPDESVEKFVSPLLFPRDSIQKRGGGDAHPVSHDERIMNVLCANIFSTLPINVTANRQCNYAFQLMKQSPPRPCYLSSRCCISSRDGDDIGGKEEGRAKCASVHEAA